MVTYGIINSEYKKRDQRENPQAHNRIEYGQLAIGQLPRTKYRA